MEQTVALKKKKILIVEDEAAVKNILRDTLEKSNFSVIEAGNGQTGVALALSDHPDLILLDILMPVMNGMAALKKIRQDPWGKRIPVIILTNISATDEQLVKGMVEERPEYYLIKSDWKMQDIIKKIKKILNIDKIN